MISVERPQNNPRKDIIEILALFSAGEIKKEDLSENNQVILGYYLGLMADNPEFAAKVNSRKNQLAIMSGRKIPLYSSDKIKKLAKRKRKIKKAKPAFQLKIWQDKPISNSETHESKYIHDPEKELIELGRNLDNPFYNHKNSPITAEIKRKKIELRNLIGLPIARGKDPHVNDDFYKFLVKRVCALDIFGIFIEYDRVIDETPQELDLKIKQVKKLIDELLNQGLNRAQRFKRFNQFAKEYQNKN